MASFSLGDDLVEKLSQCSVWSEMVSAEMKNVRMCAVDRISQLSAQNKKLVLLDDALCRTFVKDSSTIMQE